MTKIDPLLQLGLYDYVWGNPTLLQTYNSNLEAEKNRAAQYDYNAYLKEYDRAKLEEEKAKRESVAKATAEAKVTELLDGYGYKTPQQRALIDRQIAIAVADGGLNPESVNTMKDFAVENAKDEMLERSAMNAVLDPIKSKIRLHGTYSAEPNWKGVSKEEAKTYQKLLGFKGKEVDGIIGKNTLARIKDWNDKHPENQITAPNELDTILNEIDQLSYTHNGETKQFSPDVLDELRKMVYEGDDPTAQRREDWANWQHQRDKDAAGKAADDKDLETETLNKINAGKGPSSMTQEQRDKAKELGYAYRHGKWSK